MKVLVSILEWLWWACFLLPADDKRPHFGESCKFKVRLAGSFGRNWGAAIFMQDWISKATTVDRETVYLVQKPVIYHGLGSKGRIMASQSMSTMPMDFTQQYMPTLMASMSNWRNTSNKQHEMRSLWSRHLTWAGDMFEVEQGHILPFWAIQAYHSGPFAFLKSETATNKAINPILICISAADRSAPWYHLSESLALRPDFQ